MNPVDPACPPAPTILFGACDRHNFGDLLFPHVTAALLPDEAPLCAGLATRDLRPWGGHEVQAIARLAADFGRRGVRLIQVGGEILDCTAWQAAAMLLPPEQAQATIARLERHPRQRLAWTRRQLGLSDRAPYVLSRQRFPHARRLIHCGVGGVGLGQAPAALRREVLAKLAAADAVGVRDRLTQAHLQAAGLAVRLLPDPAVMVADLFGATIRRHASQGEPAGMAEAFPAGYLAFQCSADFGDDATLAALGAQLAHVSATSGLALALFRAGAAPWHDDLDSLQRLAAYLPSHRVRLFTSLQVWGICALIAGSRGYCGSSLHGRIIAMAYGLPRLNVIHPACRAHLSKQAAYAATWEAPGLPTAVGPEGLAEGLRLALAADPVQLQATARAQVAAFRQGFAALCQEEAGSPRPA